ncbi:MAG: hypothetical protein K9L86_00580 [Candidatus Omnitrophica bacterium]|nr:hypothetical protein [Candidatus Omnitrophota bacterium]
MTTARYSKNTERLLLGILAVISLLVTLYCQYPLLTNKYAINDDVRQEIYFYSNYNNSNLFRNDPITDYYRSWNPSGLNTFYYFASLFHDPIGVTKILPFFLCVFSALYMFGIGKILKGNLCGFLSGLLFISLAWSREAFEVFGTGNGEDFAVVFCVMFLYYLLKKDLLKSSITLILLSLFHPSLLLICLLTQFLVLIIDCLKHNKSASKKLLGFMITLIIIFLILWPKYLSGQIKLTKLKEMKAMEEFYPGGRKPLFFESSYERWTNYESGLAIDYPLRWLFGVASIALLVLRKKILKVMPPQLFYFIFISFVLFGIANLFMYSLYGPSRYVRYPLPLFLIFIITLGVSEITQKIKVSAGRIALITGFIALIGLSFAPKLHAHYVVAPYPGLYRFLSTLPESSLIAGHPVLMDDVPTFAKRIVFISQETSMPYYANFYPFIKKRTYDFFRAYYSNDLREIDDFFKKYNITHMVVQKSNFSEDYIKRSQFYFNPFNAYVEDIIKNRKKFALMDVPQDSRLFETEDVFVIAKDSLVF